MKSTFVKRLLFVSFLAPASCVTVFSQTEGRLTISDDKLVGNVYGRVVDKATDEPINGAEVFLFDQTIRRVSGGTVVRTNRGDFIFPDVQFAVRRGTTNENGQFLINFVPTPFPSKVYAIVVRAAAYGLFIIDEARVLLGAVMALRVDCRLEKNASVGRMFSGADTTAPLKYRDEEVVTSALLGQTAPSFLQETKGIKYSVFATREGLVGGTTANGHVIVSRDHFVALPSRRVLNANDRTSAFQVRLTSGGKTIVAPVWDVGPWNTRDDYWDESGIREMWQDLAQGTPEAQAAYQNNYNGGHDQFGRLVLNPAGIDLADGTFWDDLALTDNAWVQVDYLWRPGVNIGDLVQTTANLSVRSAPAVDPPTGQEPSGGIGTIVDGPQGATFGGTFYLWWKIRWNDGLLGWSIENYLQKTTVTNISVTVQTVPQGRSLTVDGATSSTTQTLTWGSGTSHTIGTITPQIGENGARYVWSSWSDSGAISHTVAPVANMTYTASFAIAQSYVQGDVSGTWTKTASPYVAVGQLTIPSGQTLIIQPGVTVKFAQGLNLTVNGVLTAVGTSIDSILFTSAEPNPTPGQWGQVIVNNPNPIDPPSVLQYCIVEYGGGNNQSAISTYYKLQISNSLVRHNSSGIELWGSGASIVNSTVREQIEEGIRGAASQTGGPTIRGCTIRQNGSNGINLYSNGYPTLGKIKLCQIDNNQGWGIYCSKVGWNNSNFRVEIDSCYISQNSLGGIYASGYSVYTEVAVVLTRSIISGNTGAAVYEPGDGSTIENNTIVGNSQGVISIRKGNSVIRNNIVAFNAGNGLQTYVSPSPSIIFNNLFHNTINYQGFSSFYGNLISKNRNGDSSDVFSNISLDPQFVDLSTNDYHLKSTSPMIDAGDTTNPEDPDGTFADIGAYYYSKTTSVNNPVFIPNCFLLRQNFPNPFNPLTTISYQLPTNALVVLKVFGVLGREVETLVNGRQSAGNHSVRFDGTDLPSGVYFYRLEAGRHHDTKKLLLLK